MSGHSKWSKVKHQKEVTDAVKGSAFTKVSRAITIAVHEGGGIADPEKNYHLRLAIEKARQVNMPKDTIERAVEKGIDRGGNALEQVIYEGYGPGGIALIIEAATDNRARTVSEIKHIIEQGGGTLASPGSVNFLFDRIGVITIAKGTHILDTLLGIAIEAGADDVVAREGVFHLYTKVEGLEGVRKNLEEGGIVVIHSELSMIPKTIIEVSPIVETKLHALVKRLSELDDVQKVYTDLKESA